MLAGPVETVHCTVTLAGQVITGGVVSSMLMTCTQVVLLPQSSIAVQVLVIVYSGPQPPAKVTSLLNTSGKPLQLSVALAKPVVSVEVSSMHSKVRFAGQVMTGGVVSSTCISWTQVAVLPQSSVAIQVLTSRYSWLQPSCVEKVTSLYVTAGDISQLSDEVAVPLFAGRVVSSHSIVTSDGQEVMTGGVVSSTVISCAHEVLFPHASVTVQSLKKDPPQPPLTDVSL